MFQTMLANATRLCDAKFGVLYRHDGGAFHLAAQLGAPPAYAEFFIQLGAFRALAGGLLDRLTRTKDVVHTADDSTEQSPTSAAKLGGALSNIAVPMFKDDELIGAVAVYHQDVRPFTDKQIELVKSFASQAVIAIENVRLLNELRQRTDDLSESLWDCDGRKHWSDYCFRVRRYAVIIHINPVVI